MKRPKIYIDGQSGTTGLEIRNRLEKRDDIELLLIDEDKRHDDDERRRLMSEADLVFLCLPDKAAIEAAKMVNHAKIIDASTAHRTQWTYGFPELDKDQKEKIRKADKVANPGCHATGFISIVAPLIKGGLLKKDSQLTAVSLTGYSGGGKKMIADYEGGKTEQMNSPKPYGLDLHHKHLPEMVKITGLEKAPIFVPVVDDYRQGMIVMVGIPIESFTNEVSAETVADFYRDWYKNTHIEVNAGAASLYANELADTDRLALNVSGNEGQILVCAQFDNLGKGASGAAIQNMNIMLGLDEEAGLELGKE